jgi:hypothetical protein
VVFIEDTPFAIIKAPQEQRKSVYEQGDIACRRYQQPAGFQVGGDLLQKPGAVSHVFQNICGESVV